MSFILHFGYMILRRDSLIKSGIWFVFAYSSHRSHGYVNYVMLRRGTCTFSFVMIVYQADLATERQRQLTTVRANQTAGLTNGKAAKWAPEVEFSTSRALSRRQTTFPFCC